MSNSIVFISHEIQCFDKVIVQLLTFTFELFTDRVVVVYVIVPQPSKFPCYKSLRMFAAVHFHHCFLANILQAETTIPLGYKCEIINIGH